MKKTEAIRIISECAKLYRQNLENQNILFVFGSEKAPQVFEASFLPRQFLHLTGVELSPARSTGSSDFYEKCLKGRLSPRDFEFSKNGTTEMKLSVLPQLMNIHRSAKMVGDYDYTKSVLHTERLAGNVMACLGFVREGTYYVPNTAIREDIRNITKKPQMRVLAIFKKAIRDELYSELCYAAKGVDIIKCLDYRDVNEKIDKTALRAAHGKRDLSETVPST